MASDLTFDQINAIIAPLLRQANYLSRLVRRMEARGWSRNDIHYTRGAIRPRCCHGLA
jgi:hypothetical protein